MPENASITGGAYSSGFEVKYSNGTRTSFPIYSCPRRVKTELYQVASAIETNPRFVAAENGSICGVNPTSAFLASGEDFTSGTYTCTVPTFNGTYTHLCTKYTEVQFQLISNQRVYFCGNNSAYKELGEIDVNIPLDAHGGLVLSGIIIKPQSPEGLNVFLCTTQSTSS